jgi:hypothetical protein
MDAETISTLKTVCTAGRASEGFNGDANERLNQLKNLGLLVVAYAPGLLADRVVYEPTANGREVCVLAQRQALKDELGR